MCTVSNIGDAYKDAFPQKWPGIDKFIYPVGPDIYPTIPLRPVDRGEFEALKKEVEALKDVLKAAKKFDEETNQPDCEKAR